MVTCYPIREIITNHNPKELLNCFVISETMYSKTVRIENDTTQTVNAVRSFSKTSTKIFPKRFVKISDNDIISTFNFDIIYV